jgi:hypothetical protein
VDHFYTFLYVVSFSLRVEGELIVFGRGLSPIVSLRVGDRALSAVMSTGIGPLGLNYADISH